MRARVVGIFEPSFASNCTRRGAELRMCSVYSTVLGGTLKQMHVPVGMIEHPTLNHTRRRVHWAMPGPLAAAITPGCPGFNFLWHSRWKLKLGHLINRGIAQRLRWQGVQKGKPVLQATAEGFSLLCLMNPFIGLATTTRRRGIDY
jgi:hypothetical protein